jgi:cyclohexyl-isocyanide hydratase
MNRRDFNQNLTTALVASLFGQTAAAAPAKAAPADPMAMAPSSDIAMLLYPGMTALDLIGPQYAFGLLMDTRLHLVAKTRDVVMTDTGVGLQPTIVLSDCPKELEVLFVPGGGTGTLAAMEDPDIVSFVADRGSRAKWVTSVCTGSLILAAAGLLRGRRATSHWLVRDVVLPLLGVTPVAARVVEDGNRITGAGVSAGLDLGLAIVARLKGDDYARAVQLMAEYDPQPPFSAGSPEKAGPAITKMMVDMHAGLLDHARAAATRARDRMPA